MTNLQKESKMNHFNRQLQQALDNIQEDINRYLKIGYDLDDVLADLDQILRQRLSKLVQRYISKPERTSFYFEDIPTILQKLGLTKEQLGPLVVDCFKHISMDKLPAVESAIRTIKNLQKDGHTIIIITARSKKQEATTKHWLNNMGLKGIQIFFAGSGPIRTAPKNSKAKIARLLKLDYFIDDSTENLEQFTRTGQHKLTTPIAYTQPWNRDWRGPRISTHDETQNLLNKLE
jgi:5'(3')-deoxyribonucleotidase